MLFSFLSILIKVQAGVFYLVLYQLKILELKKLKYSQKTDACLFHGWRNNQNLF